MLLLPELKELDLHYNRIQYFPEDLSELLRLEEIQAWSNPLPREEKERLKRVLGGRIILE